MAKLCCFLCPTKDYSEKNLNDVCPTCGNTYGFPLTSLPKMIRGFKIVRRLSRGFYAATYVANRPGMLTRPVVLKVVSKAVYDFFNKNFAQECRDHAKVADGLEHVVQIEDGHENVEVAFGDLKLLCHVAILQFVDGDPLGELLDKPERLSARAVAQIGIDLFRMVDELRGKVAFHNDLHGANIMVEKVRNRPDAIDPKVHTVAIDLGSISDASKSDTEEQRLGDIHWIANHLLQLVDHLLRDNDKTSDLDYRLASALEEIAHRLLPSSAKSRLPEMSDLVEEIRSACHHVSSPWSEPFKLRNFNDSYNAQTLAPWYVPLLLVDPREEWLTRMSTPGPQIITGMRGCGKTLFLRALQFHARAAARNGDGLDNILDRLKTDKFIGLYISTNRLLDRLGSSHESLHEPYARLYAAYGLEAIRAVEHLNEVSPDDVVINYASKLAKSIGDFLSGGDKDIRQLSSAHELQHALIRILVLLSRGESSYSLTANPAVAFPHLAHAIQGCSPLWSNAYVLYLLDDVSTRYLEEPKIKDLLSSLLFQSASCAFKITSEAQTLELALRSPGRVERARVGRDYDVFDLGAEVYSRISTRRRTDSSDNLFGKQFVEQILTRPAKYYFNHPQASPGQLLGDANLESIAGAIATTSKTSREKKEIYHGITALTRVCVGDIGDVISLYEMILQNAEGHTWPIPPAIQSESYQDFCSRRLYDLNRRAGELKDVALSFAAASHELLVKSYRENAALPTTRDRLRQYMSIYVRITTGNTKWQYERLRELIDSGLFVFAGGSDTPRTKTKDSNPTQQFKLTFRKIYGLSNFIGLAESDRFELSGGQLEGWLKKPSKKVLMRNLGGCDEIEETQAGNDKIAKTEGSSLKRKSKPYQMTQQQLFKTSDKIGEIDLNPEIPLDVETQQWLDQYIPSIEEVPIDDLAKFKFAMVVLGLGFEDRTFASAKRLCRVIKANEVVLFKYAEPGKGKQIEQLAGQIAEKMHIINYGLKSDTKPTIPSGEVLVDTTGLAKPILFRTIRSALMKNGAVWVCHTRAQSYYPQENDLVKIMRAERARDPNALLASMGSALTGEKGPYRIYRLQSTEVDQSRRRALFAFASAKHERLLTLLDTRGYDHVEVIAPRSGSARGALARIAAQVAANNFGRGVISEVDTNDLSGILTLLMRKYQHWYVRRGFNVDLALTGSKLQGVASAVLSAAVKISDSLYVSPQSFDPRRFTRGVGETRVYKITLR